MWDMKNNTNMGDGTMGSKEWWGLPSSTFFFENFERDRTVSSSPKNFDIVSVWIRILKYNIRLRWVSPPSSLFFFLLTTIIIIIPKNSPNTYSNLVVNSMKISSSQQTKNHTQAHINNTKTKRSFTWSGWRSCWTTSQAFCYAKKQNKTEGSHSVPVRRDDCLQEVVCDWILPKSMHGIWSLRDVLLVHWSEGAWAADAVFGGDTTHREQWGIA